MVWESFRRFLKFVRQSGDSGKKFPHFPRDGGPRFRGPGFFLRYAWFGSGCIFCVSLALVDKVLAFST